MAAKKTRKTQVPTARLVITICAIALAFGAWFLTKTSFTVLKTQWTMYSFYCDINEANAQHDYFYDMARMYPLGGYMHSAEEWDDKAEALTKERANFVANATDPVVKWACRDQCEVLTVLAGVAELIVAVALWFFDGCIVLALYAAFVSDKKRQQARHQVSAQNTQARIARSNLPIAPYRRR